MEKVNYKGWPNCLRLNNEQIEIIITTDIGPRIIRLGFIGQENEFKEFPEVAGKTGGDTWYSYGGHRLWHAPEHTTRTYYPDNSTVSYQLHKDFLRLIQPVETTTGIQKEIDIHLSARRNHVKLTHRLRNTNLWAVDLSIWALSVMDTGGKAILPLPPRGFHGETLLPSSSLTLWPYTDLSDPRWTFGNKYILLQQDPRGNPQKIGASVPDGWMAYARGDHLFVKKVQYVDDATYPDFGCNMETFTNEEILEVESLSPLVKVGPGMDIEHVEDWYLYKGIPIPQNDEDVIKHILPKITDL